MGHLKLAWLKWLVACSGHSMPSFCHKTCSAIDVWLVEGLPCREAGLPCMGTASVLQELALVAYNEHCVDHGSFFKLAKVHACCVHLRQPMIYSTSH